MKELSEKEMKRRLIRKRKIVKQKFDILKHGEIAKEKLFSPITKHLKDIESKLSHTVERIKTQPSTNEEPVSSDIRLKDESDGDDDVFLSPSVSTKKQKKKIPQRLSAQLASPRGQVSLNQEEFEDPSEQKLSILEEIKSHDYPDLSPTPSTSNFNANSSKLVDIAEKSYVDYLDQYEPLPRKYINGMYYDENQQEFDHKYGIRLDTLTEKLMIGDSNVDIDGSDIIVKNKRYRGTQGLYELLFKKNPKHYSTEDVDNYKKIVIKTNANRRYYKSNKQVDGSKLKKYKKIIAPMVSGKGILMEADNNKIDYIHWDDPNELVDRLRLLIASASAGHTGHTNEINSIVEELREAKIII